MSPGRSRRNPAGFPIRCNPGRPRASADRRVRWLVMLALLSVLAGPAAAIENPTSSGEVSMVETNLVRVPKTDKPPTIDGKMAEGEWVDATAMSGFWYWNYTRTTRYDYLAPFQTQLQVYACYDNANLYLAFTSPIYPRNSWLRARGRFPDVIEHPLYGIYRDDYVSFYIRPYHDTQLAHRLGGFGWYINPINSVADYGPQATSESGPEGGRKWSSGIRTAREITPDRWVQEIVVPMEPMHMGPYTGTDKKGNKLLKLPVVDGTMWCFSLDRCTGEWGTAGFHNKFSDSTSKMIFDSEAASVQINELGPIMEDIIDVRLTLKNHAEKSQTVRLGFFVESAAGMIYSSYDDRQIKDGLLELKPGEVRKLRLRKPFPGINIDGNVLWFDVRATGNPAKALYRSKLIYFHAQNKPDFQEEHIDRLADNRLPRKDFDLRVDYSYHHDRVSAVVDTGIHGASEEAQTAVEAKIVVSDMTDGERQLAEEMVAFDGPFACALIDLPELSDGHAYNVVSLLFDPNKRIVGEMTETFVYEREPYMDHAFGQGDIVWEPFVPMKVINGNDGSQGIDTLNVSFTLDRTGLPRQVWIKPDARDLPLELRGEEAAPTPEQLVRYGRGPQLRGGYRIEAVIDGKRVGAEVVEPAKLVRQWDSELEYAAKLRAGPVDITLTTQYDCDGAMHVRMAYGSEGSAVIDRLELVADYRGPMDMTPGVGKVGVVWDSSESFKELYYSHFVPWHRFGSNERGFSWICRNERGWMLDRDSTVMTLERDEQGEVTWRTRFVNHRRDVQGRRELAFTVLTHPSKPRPVDARTHAWFYRGDTWAHEYMMHTALKPEYIAHLNRVGRKHQRNFKAYKGPEDYLRRHAWHALDAPRDTPYQKLKTMRDDSPPWNRYGLCRNVGVHPLMDRTWEDKNVFYFERQIRAGRRCGFWWDEYYPMFSEATWSDNLASGDAVLRDPALVKEGELPWQRGFMAEYLRSSMKRIARILQRENLPNRNHVWALKSANAFESFAWDIQLVEFAGSDHSTYELDSVVNYGTDAFRYFCHKWTGTIARVVPGYGGRSPAALPGDDKRFDRQYLGRALAHDIGACFDGPHGRMHHPEQGVRLLRRLIDWGFFQEQAVEFLPYWRNGRYIRFGRDFGDQQFTIATVPGEKRVIASVYRRAIEEDGRRGYEAIIVLMNEADEIVEADLHLLDVERLLGGPNTLELRDLHAQWDGIDSAAAKLLAEWSGGGNGNGNGNEGRADATAGGQIVLRDFESDRYVPRKQADGNGETYGPVHIPEHDYRLLYAMHLTEAE